MAKRRRKSGVDKGISRETRTRSRVTPDLWIHLLLFVAIFATYFPVRQFAFVQYDDPDYSLNPHVREGITRASLRWAVTSGEDSNWFPMTRLSHLMDAQLFGLRSGWHHLSNVLLHSISALLLFAFLRRSTGAVWRSACVALLFGIHPLHVESVAWVAERKDVLCALFWFLTLWTYLRYSECPSWSRYLLVLFVFSLGLMSKPMMVTLPFVLLLLDVWPLRRLPIPGITSNGSDAGLEPVRSKRVLWEKVPLLLLSAGVAATAYLTQRGAGALDMIRLSVHTRLENALLSYVVYIAQMFWPSHLAVLYPYPTTVPLWQSVCAGLIIAGATGLVMREARKFPYLALGWFWYLGTLVPVIGLIQIGLQSHADRYTYVPVVGLFLMLSWGAADLVGRWPSIKPAVICALALGCGVLVIATEIQLQYWKDSEVLYKRAISVTDGNYTMHYGLGVLLGQSPRRIPEAIEEYRAALATKPDFWEAHDNLATLLLDTPGHLSEAIEHYQAALRIRPDSAELHNNLGAALSETGTRQGEAISQYEEAIRIRPDFVEAHSGLADTFAAMPGRLPEAIAQYRAALRLRPDSAELHNNLGGLLARDSSHIPEAIEQCEIALQIRPDFAGAHYNLGVILASIPERMPEAIVHLEAVLRVTPNPQLRQMIEHLRRREQ